MTSVQLDSGPSAPPLTPALKEVLSPVQVCSPSKQTTPGTQMHTNKNKQQRFKSLDALQRLVYTFCHVFSLDERVDVVLLLDSHTGLDSA